MERKTKVTITYIITCFGIVLLTGYMGMPLEFAVGLGFAMGFFQETIVERFLEEKPEV
jgi:hypothetical protein